MKRLIDRWRRRRELESGLTEEMQFHLEARAEDLAKRERISREEAMRRARIEFGGAARYREEVRAALGYRIVDELRADLRYALRGLKKSPGFALTAIGILALAIGANAALYILYSNYMLRPLPIRGAERHFNLEGRDDHGRGTGGWTIEEIAALTSAAGGQIEGFYSSGVYQALLLAPVTRQVFVSAPSPNFFALLGGRAALGRTFDARDEYEPVAVLSDSGRRKLFPGDAAPLGRTVRIGAVTYTIVGIAEPEFTGPEPVIPDFWVPRRFRGALRDDLERSPRFPISGIMSEGAKSPAALAGVLSATASRFDRPVTTRVARVQVRPRNSFVDTNDAGPNVVAGSVFAIFLLVLLIACANLANLFLARAAARTSEMTVRLSLGASRFRLIRQQLTESTLVASMAAAGGLAIALLTAQRAQDYLLTQISKAGLTVLPLSLQGSVWIYTMLIGIGAGISFGLLPAFEATARRGTSLTQRDSFAGRVRPRRLRNLMLSGQVAASVVLLILAGILVRNVQRLDATSPGYDIDRTFDLRIESIKAPLLDRLRQEPGITAMTAVNRVPLYGSMNQHSAAAAGHSFPIAFNHVDHRYFETMGLEVVQGQVFDARAGASKARVAVISESTARRLWPRESALGQTIEIKDPGEDAGTYEITGIVRDAINGWYFEGREMAIVYLPAAAVDGRVNSIIARIESPSPALLNTIREVCATTAGGAGCDPVSLREISAMQRFPFEAAAAISSTIGGLGLVLTALGLYSVASYSVVQRKREIGVQMAIGATPANIMRQIIGEAARRVLWGLAVGLPICLALSRIASASVLRIDAFDWAAYLGVPAVLAAITLAACAVPARRAAQLDPMRCLRGE